MYRIKDINKVRGGVGIVAAIIIAFVTVVSCSMSTKAQDYKLKTISPYTLPEVYKNTELGSALGVATEFGVFVEEKTVLTGHMDSNVATTFLDMGANFGAGNYTDGVKGMNYIAAPDWLPASMTIQADKLIVGNDSAGLYADNGSNWSVEGVKIGTKSDISEMWYSDSENPFIDLKGEFERLRKLSDSYGAMGNSDGAVMQNNTIDFSNTTEKVAYYNMDLSEYVNTISGVNVITGNAQLCVINVNMLNMKKYNYDNILLQRVKIDGVSTSDNSYNCNKVIWNFYGDDGVKVMCDETTGTILAPANNFYMAGTSAGRFIVKNFSNGGEAHFTFRLRVKPEEETTTVPEEETTTVPVQETTTVPVQEITTVQEVAADEDEVTKPSTITDPAETIKEVAADEDEVVKPTVGEVAADEDTVQTGDASNVTVYVVVALIALLAVLCVVVAMKKDERK